MKTFKEFKETEQLDELSKKTLNSYLDKNDEQRAKRTTSLDTVRKRITGSNKAIDKINAKIDAERKSLQSEETVDESSDRLKSKFIKMAEPKAKAQGAVGELTGQKDKVKKADKTLALISKVRNKMDLKKPVYESEDEL